MTTRRGVLSAIGLAALTGMAGACSEPKQTSPRTQENGDRLLIAHDSGLGIFDTGKRDWLVKPVPGVANEKQLATLDNGRLVLRERLTMGVQFETQIGPDWTIAAIGTDQVALIAGSNPVKQRERTKLRVMRNGTERRTYDLPGSVEPEAFSSLGEKLFVLVHQPSAGTYRVRQLDLETGVMDPLLTKEKKVIPPNGEEYMRGEGRHAVLDAGRGMLFSLYTHGGDHQHTGQLLGVRPDAPNIHAFIHALSLFDGWAVCIDLPQPFGHGAAASHTVALGPNTLYAIAAEHGVVAEIDPVKLAIRGNSKLSPTPGEAFAVFTDQLIVAAGKRIADRDLGFPVRGLAKGDSGRLWVGREGGLTAIEGGNTTVTVDVPGLTLLR